MLIKQLPVLLEINDKMFLKSLEIILLCLLIVYKL